MYTQPATNKFRCQLNYFKAGKRLLKKTASPISLDGLIGLTAGICDKSLICAFSEAFRTRSAETLHTQSNLPYQH